MSHSEGTGQLSFFPELSRSISVPSISTLPEFDKSLDNLIKMSDLGAFVSITVHGVEKSYSVHSTELEIPPDFLLEDRVDAVSDKFHLFPEDTRMHLRKMVYDVKSFFNSKNSFKTPFGFFIYRPYFRIWQAYVEEREEHIDRFLSKALKGRTYGHHFLTAFREGYAFLQSIKDDTAPWEFQESVYLSHVREVRKEIIDKNATLHSLDHTFPDYPLRAIALKTMHFPLDLKSYVAQLGIQFAFRSIHLDYLKDVEIHTIEDIKRLSQKMVDEY
ncbi:MAG: hypothetical protein V3U24_07355 [Candidatus Neomarinimicrobiota bacterium]